MKEKNGEKEQETVKEQNGREPTYPGKVTIPEKEYAELREKAKSAGETRELLLRLGAEFDNFRKRMDKEKSEYLKFANAGLIMELINAVDHFERAVAAAEKSKDFDTLLQGVKMIHSELEALLKRKGLEKIKVIGEKFDPEQHEAVAEVVTDEHPESTVVEELQKGYLLEGKVLRPAAVKVSKKPEKNGPQSTVHSPQGG